MYNLFFYLYLSFSAIAAFVSISMWLDYFRKIDVFEVEKIRYLFVALFIGCFTPFLSLYIYHIIGLSGFNLNGHFYNDLAYSIFAIGVNEEFSKIAGVVIVFFLLRKQITEPIDYLIYAGVTALGFSIVENFKYFNNYGIQIISTRAFYSALVHIINTTIIVYGVYRLKLFDKGNLVANTVIAFMLSVASHGLFDFFLLNNFLGHATPLFATLVYLIGINFWVQMLNNANNYSTYFNYEKIHFSGTIFYRLLFWYLTTLIITIIYNMIVFDSEKALRYFFNSLSSDGLLLLIVIMRASRFHIFKRRYFEVKLGLPFYITKNNDEDFKFLYLLPIKIRGESAHEYQLTTYLNKEVELHPLSSDNTYLKTTIKVRVNDKLFLNDDVVIYKAETETETYFLKPKTYGDTQTKEDYPISGLFKLRPENSNVNLDDLSLNQLLFLDWVYIK